MVVIKVRDFGEIKLELDKENAPITCENFESLINKGFYNGLTFHRIIKNFMIQGGCPKGNGTGGPGYGIKGEFAANGIDNKIRHARGTISMARSYLPDSAGSQFFICDKDDFFLDGQYAAFGHVVEGMDVVDKIASSKTDRNDRPYERVVIDTITIE